MLGSTFYHSTLRSIVTGFGTLFNDLEVERRNNAGEVVQTIKVPVSYGPKQPWYYRLTMDPNAGNVDPNQTTQSPVQSVLPRITYELTNIVGNWQEHPSTMQKYVGITEVQGELKQVFTPIPVLVGFELNIITKNLVDSLQIVEQIVPWFTPNLVVQMNLIPEINRNVDVMVTLQYPITPVDNWTEAMKERRDITWTLHFAVNAMLYGPVKNKPIILDAQVRSYVDPSEIGNTYVVSPDPPDAMANEEFGFTVESQ